MDIRQVAGSFDQVFKDVLKDLQPTRVLDIACGTGGFINLIQAHLPEMAHFVGIDLSLDRIIEASQALPLDRVDLLQMNAVKLGFTDQTFDLVSSGVSLHHMQDIGATLHEMKRVLLPGRHCLISEMYRDGQNVAQLSEVYLHHWVASIDRESGISHNQTLTRQEIIQQVAVLNWTEIRVYDFTNPLTDQEPEQIIEQVEAVVNRTLERTRGLANSDSYLSEGERILEWVKEHGMQRTSLLILLCS